MKFLMKGVPNTQLEAVIDGDHGESSGMKAYFLGWLGFGIFGGTPPTS